jgi:putative ABC transport system ATP-binding protein
MIILPAIAAPSRTAVIEINDVHKAYRRGSTLTPVLQGVDMRVEQGECVFLAGPSGSGKSTLLSILGCILTPDRGTIRIQNEDVALMNNLQRTLLRRERIGFVFQRFQLIRGLTVFDNVQVPLTLAGSPARQSRERVLHLLEAVGLGDKARALPQNLSGGQCQRVALARALAANPDLILADEPTASLDASTGHQVMELLRTLIAQERKTAIVVTHDQRIYAYADRIYHLENGRIPQKLAA